MDRKEQLENLFKDADEQKKILAAEIIENVVFLENQISGLRKLPQILIHPTMPEIQKRSDASKMIIPYLQQLNLSTKLLASLLNNEGGEGDDLAILREFQEKVKNL